MLQEKHIVTRKLHPAYVQLARKNAKIFTDAKLPSHLRHVEERGRTESIDSFVGNMAALMASVHLFGDKKKYEDAAWVANKFPAMRKVLKNDVLDDGGCDIIGLNIDFKASLIRNENKNLLSYNAPVRPHEFYSTHIYLFIFMEALEGKTDDEKISCVDWRSHIMGWCVGQDYIDDHGQEPNGTGVFEGAHVLPVTALNPVIPWVWQSG